MQDYMQQPDTLSAGDAIERSKLTRDFLEKTTLILSQHESKLHLASIINDAREKIGKLESLFSFRHSIVSDYACNHCFTPWKEGKFRLRLIPRNPKTSIKKIIKRQTQARNSFEKKLMTKWHENGQNRLVKKCLVCNHSTSQTMVKTVVRPQTEEKETEQPKVEPVKDEPKKKKKKKKKVKYAGLNAGVIESMRQTVEQNVKSKESQKIKKPKQVENSMSIVNEPVKEEDKPKLKPPLKTFEVILTEPSVPIISSKPTAEIMENSSKTDTISKIFSSLSKIDPEKFNINVDSCKVKIAEKSVKTADVKNLPQTKSGSNQNPIVEAMSSSILLQSKNTATEILNGKNKKKNNNSFILNSLKSIKKGKGKKNKKQSFNKNVQVLPQTSLLLKELLE